MTLLNKLLSLYHTSLRTLSLRGACISHFFPTTSWPLVAASPLHPLHLTLEPPVPPALLDRLTNPNPTIRPHVLALEFTRRPEPTVLAALLAAHCTNAVFTALALPTLTTTDAALVAGLP